MLETKKVLEKLKNILGYTNDFDLARDLGVKLNTLSSWKIRNTLRYDRIIELSSKNKIDLNELFLKTPESIYKNKIQKRQVNMISVEDYIEYFLHPDKFCNRNTFYFPTEEEIDMAFQIGMANMCPTIKVSSYVLVKRIDLKEIKSWSIYLLVVKGKGIICARFKQYTSSKELLFTCDNPTFDDLLIKGHDVKEIFSIQGIFSPSIRNISDY